VCGWSPEEVAEDLEFLVGGKYYGTFGDGVRLTVEGDRTIIIRGTTEVQRIQELVDLEKEDVRSLKSIQAIDVADGAASIRLHEPIEPEMYPSPDGREVKCLLFRSDAPAPAATAARSAG